jgi:spermidine synthase
MITESSSSVMEATPVQESAPGSNRRNSDGAGMGRLLNSFRLFIIPVFLGSVCLPPLAYLSSPVNGDVIPSPVELYLRLGLYGAAALAMLVALRMLLRRLEPHLLQESLDQAAFLENIPDRFLSVAIAGSALLSLFLELAIIRWQGSIFEFFAFYKNYGLLACFAGLGLGYALSRSKEGIPLILAVPLLAWQFGLLIALRWGLPNRPYSLQTIPFQEQLSMGLQTTTWDRVGIVYLLLTVVFLLTALTFIPVGQLCGKLMERKSQLPAYGFNLLGSLAGVLLMFLVSFLWTPPVVWFALSFAILLLFLVRKSRTLLLAMGLAIIALTTLAWPVNPMWNKIYSPYQSLDLGYGPNGLMFIRAAGHYYQRVHNLSNSAVAASADPVLHAIRNYYDFPYRVRPKATAVAVVGAGSGNDVAAALRSGAQHVDAIEIDPAILLAGKTNHPERPYSDPRVRPIINDARSFFRTTEGRYDLIVYGLLDSHTLLSQASSVRLDSFVYTVEGLREARSRLKPNGVLSLSFSVLNNALGTKIYQMMKQAFDGNEPLCFFPSYDGAQVFMQSKNGDLSIPPAVLSDAHAVEGHDFYRNSAIKVDLSTDDWPFLYMPRRVYPVSYLVVLGLILLLSFVLYASFFREQPKVSHIPFFFLGAGFMLVETKAITEMGLTFGNTWQVIAFAIASILVMAFLANSLVQRLRVRGTFSLYFLLFVSLAVGWWVATSGGLPSTIAGRIGTAVILTCPLFFSGIVFSTLLSAESRISSVMSMNLMGAMCGGILEYNSMYFGFHFLYLLALALYAAALLSGLTFRKTHVLPALEG